MNNKTLPPCDLVMKGGITSGVVYPKLIAKLSENWRFKSVGGTSAGAIAAAGCAAAELGRQSGRNAEAFAQLAQLPQTLGRPAVPGDKNSMLFRLFKPAPWLKGHFGVLVGALNRKDKLGLVFGALWAMLRKFWIVTLLAVVTMGLLGVPAVLASTALNLHDAIWLLVHCTLLAAAVWALFGFMPGRPLWRLVLAVAGTALVCVWQLRAYAGLSGAGSIALATLLLMLWLVVTTAVAMTLAAARFVLSLLAGLQRNGWGLCSGHGADEASKPQALTDWLVDYFDGLAGRDGAGRPLTFGDLWGLPEQPPTDSRENTPPADREIDLQVMTTAVSQRLCYALPLREKTGGFYYQREEWAALFPRRVMEWLDQVSSVLDDPAQPVLSRTDRPLRHLPRNQDLPVVVAVRMSLSFPVLLSAVPLYAIDRTLHVQGQPTPRPTKIWFSDGGISSNMPLHFFDAALPSRPTFAVNLKGEHPLHPIDPKLPASRQDGRVYLPDNNSAGQAAHWDAPQDDKPTGLFGFLANIIDTMQNWRDHMQLPYPGYRDRIVQVSQRADEGGLNLNMPPPNIERLADAGEYAAEVLSRHFDPALGNGWANHKDIRVRSFLALVEELVRSRNLQDLSWDEVVQSVDVQYLNAPEREMARHMLQTMRDLGQQFDARAVSVSREPPRPKPQLRISPRI
jgi:predicted acylesterase/phospholipase RssA